MEIFDIDHLMEQMTKQNIDKLDIDKLKRKNNHNRDQYIWIYEPTHTYHVYGNTDYTSVTTWINSHFPKFDTDTFINNMMKSWKFKNSESKRKYNGMTKEEIKQKWKNDGKIASEAGTLIHYNIECYYNDNWVDDDSVEFGYFLRFDNLVQQLPNSPVPYRTEWQIFDEDNKLAGTIDMVYQNMDGSLDLVDWKRCKEIKTENKWQKSITPCLSDFPDTNFWHYTLQLNTYKFIIEKNYGKKINSMYIVNMHPNNSNKSFQMFQVQNFQKQIKQLLK